MVTIKDFSLDIKSYWIKKPYNILKKMAVKINSLLCENIQMGEI